MLTYRRIEDRAIFAAIVWMAEQQAPAWFRAASVLWTPDYRAFLKFWKDCGEIWGLFEDDQLAACVYLEFKSPRGVNIHLSVIKRLPEDEIVRFFSSLTAQKASDGVVIRKGWILTRNKALARIAGRCGYNPTGLMMRYGSVRGRVLKWMEVQG